tara:strand:+ start:42585 stop:43904 length:1320 start_codon:yes stop_codon:yes gene_type:complete
MKSKVNEIFKYFLDNKIKNVLLSISSGVDSLVLLHVLLRTREINNKLNISLFHTNYNFHNKSNDAELLCRQISSKFNLKLHLLNKKLNNKNFEHNARKIRYNEIFRLVKEYNYDKVLTAHNYNDQLETLIMKDNDNANWISRIGIRKKNHLLYRPILDINKKQIYNYAKKNNLIWIEDSTNKDISFTRNKIRYLISKNRYKKIYYNNLIKLKNKSDVKYFDYLNKFKKNSKDFILRKSKYFIEINLNFLDFFSSLETKLFFNYLVSSSFKDEALKITDSHWFNIYEIIKNGRNGTSINLSNRILLQKERGSIIISIPRTLNNKILINDENETYNWYDSHISFKSFENNDMNIVPINLIKNGSYISHWKKGDKIRLKNSTKKISDIFINNKISNYDKLYYPVIRGSKGNVICVPDLATMYYSKFNKSKCLSLIMKRGDLK